MKTRAMFVVALLLATAAPAGAAVERGASVGYCEGCDNGVVDLTMDGGTARVTNLKRDDATGHWFGVGKLSYHAQGVAIEDTTAAFDVELVPSPTGTVKSPTDCTRATLLASAITASGGKGSGAWTLTTSDFAVDVSAPCARATLTATIELRAPKARANRVTVSGRIIKH